jgi:hypothetical protein
MIGHQLRSCPTADVLARFRASAGRDEDRLVLSGILEHHRNLFRLLDGADGLDMVGPSSDDS